MDVGPARRLKDAYAPKQVIDARGGIVMPGLINAHTHAAMTLFRGYADDLPLKEWLEKHIWLAEARHVSPDTVRTGTLLAIAEMVRSGTTLFNDMYFFEDEVAQVAKGAGMRAMVGECLLDFPTPNKKTPQEGLSYTEGLIRKWKDDPLIRVAVAPHSVYALSPEHLKAAAALAKAGGVPCHIHLSETLKEVAEAREKCRLTPVEHLDSLGVLGGNVVATHCVQLTENDRLLLARAGAGVVHNPNSNMKLAGGVAPVPDLISRKVKLGLGTDGAASNNGLNMLSEASMAAKLHKAVALDPTVVDARTALGMATLGGARVLGMQDRVGSLEKGKRADVILLEPDRPHSVPQYDPYSGVVYAMDRGDVGTVIIDGRVVMRDRRILSFDEGKAVREMKAPAEKIRAARTPLAEVEQFEVANAVFSAEITFLAKSRDYIFFSGMSSQRG